MTSKSKLLSIFIAATSIRSFAFADISGYTQAQIAALSISQVQSLTSGEVASMTALQIGALSPTQIASFSASQISSLTSDEIASMTAAQLQVLSPFQIQAFTLSQVQQMRAAQFCIFNSTQIAAFLPQQICQLGYAQIKAMQTPFSVAQILLIPQAQIDSMSAGQYNSIVAPILFPQMTTETIATLPTTRVSLIDIDTFNLLNSDQISSLTADPVFALMYPTLGEMSSAQFAALTPTQVGALLPNSIFGITPENIATFRADQIAALPALLLQSMSSAQIAAINSSLLNSTQLDALTDAARAQSLQPIQLKSLTTAQIMAMTPAQFAACSFQQIYIITADQISTITADQIAALPYSYISFFKKANIAALSPAQIASLPVNSFHDNQISGFSQTQFAALSFSSIQYISVVSPGLSTTHISWLTSAQAAALTKDSAYYFTTSSIAAFQPSIIPYITPTFIASLEPILISKLSLAQLTALTPVQIKVMTPAQVQSLSYIPVSLFKNLSAVQVAALTSSQIQSLDSTSIASISYSQVQGFTIPQLQALTTLQKSMLTNVQIGNMSPAQLAALGLPAQGVPDQGVPASTFGTSTAMAGNDPTQPYCVVVQSTNPDGMTIYRIFNNTKQFYTDVQVIPMQTFGSITTDNRFVLTLSSLGVTGNRLQLGDYVFLDNTVVTIVGWIDTSTGRYMGAALSGGYQSLAGIGENGSALPHGYMSVGASIKYPYPVPSSPGGATVSGPDFSTIASITVLVAASGGVPAHEQAGWYVNGQFVYAVGATLTASQSGPSVPLTYTDPQTGATSTQYGWTVNGTVVLDPTNNTGGPGGTSNPGSPTEGTPGSPTQGNSNPPPPAPPPGGAPVVTQCLNTFTATMTCSDGCTVKTAQGSTPEEASAKVKELCIKATSDGSIIDDYTFNHIHSGLDYIAPKIGSGGCASCGGTITPAAADDDPRAGVVRIHRSRDNFEPSSFGVGVYSSYDISLTLFDTAGMSYIDCFNPAWLGARRYSPSGTSFKDTIYNSCKAFNLYDAAGNLTVTRVNAVRATLVNRDGSSVDFDLFAIDANTTGGRPSAFRGIDGSQLLALSYVTLASDTGAGADEKRRIASVTDRYANMIGFTYSTLASGRYAITTATLPGGRWLNYTYDSIGNLTRVDMSGGESSTFTFTLAGNGIFQENFRDAGVAGIGRNKTVYYTNNIAADLLSDTTRPQAYNQSSMLVYAEHNGNDELTFLGLTNPASAMQRKLYEGGNRLRFTDVANDTKYKQWSAPAALSTTNPYASFAGTLETYGHIAPYQNYAANRTHTSPVVTTPEGLVHNFTYDANGNYTSHNIGTKTDWHASDPRFNKPVLDVDFTGNAVVRTYDTQGNLVSEKTGWTMDSSSPVGTTVPGLLAQFYTQPPVAIGGLTAITPGAMPNFTTSVQGFSPAYRSTTSNSAVQYTGTLTLAAAGIRTFYLTTSYYGGQLTIDGVKVLYADYGSGKRSANVNLTAGTHQVGFYIAGGVSAFTLDWKGPETLVNGVAVESAIDCAYLSHATVANELAVRPTAAAATKTWTYYPTGDALAGLLQSSVDATGKVTQYAYDSSRRMTQMSQTGDTGSMVVMQTLTYDARGNLATTTDAIGRTITYAYDDRDRRVKSSYADGTTETTTYGTGVNANLVTGQKDRNGFVTTMVYDSTGRVITTTTGYALADNDGNITTVLPQAQWSVTTNTYANGSSDVIRSVTDGKATEYDYDYKDRVVATRSFPSSGKTLSTTTAYDANEVRFMESDNYGRRTFYAYRPSDMMLVRQAQELVAGALGNLTTEAAVLALTRDTSPNPAYVITDSTLDLEGRTTLQTSARGINTAFVYDAAGRTVQTTAAAGLPEAQVSTTSYDAAGRVIATTDALSRTTTTAYTPAGRTDTVTLPDTSVQKYTYYADGRTATVTDPNNHTSTLYYTMCCGRDAGSANALGQGTLKFYDGDGHVTYAVLVNDVASALSFGPNVPSAAIVSATTTQYDARGRATASTRWLVAPTSVDPKNPPIATDATQGLTTTYAYYDDLSDARFAPVLASLAAKGVTLTTGSASVATSPTGEASFSVQDGAGRTVASGVFRKP